MPVFAPQFYYWYFISFTSVDTIDVPAAVASTFLESLSDGTTELRIVSLFVRLTE